MQPYEQFEAGISGLLSHLGSRVLYMYVIDLVPVMRQDLNNYTCSYKKNYECIVVLISYVNYRAYVLFASFIFLAGLSTESLM